MTEHKRYVITRMLWGLVLGLTIGPTILIVWNLLAAPPDYHLPHSVDISVKVK